MNLIYNSDEINADRKGTTVKVGDRVVTNLGESVEVRFFREPSSPASSGKVSVRYTSEEDEGHEAEYYVSVIGAEWVNREDRR